MQISNSASSRLMDGLRRISARDFKAVHADAIDMIHADVDDAVPYGLLGVIAAEHGNHHKAAELFKNASNLDPTEVRYDVYHARSLIALNRQSDALKVVKHATKRPLPDAWTADTVGVVYSRTGFHEKAVPFFEQAVALDPKPANYHYNLGASLQFSGAFERARDAYTETLDRDPSFYRAYSSLVMLSKQTETENHLPELQALFESHIGDADAALHFGHAISKTLEDLGRFEESLVWLKRAKAPKKSALSFDISSDLENFNAAKWRPPEPVGNPTTTSPEAPIFIIGLPRTGTTLVDRILSSHPDVVSAGELNTFAGLIKFAAKTPSKLVMDPETLRRARKLDLFGIGQDYVARTRDLARGAKRMTDKMPLNFFYAGLIHAALPNARIVALRRGAMDSCLSNYRQLFSTAYSYYNYTFDLEDTANFYRSFDGLMTYWRTSLPSNRFMEIGYEDIVLDQEAQTKRLLEFCSLDWNDACLRFHENNAPVSTASSVQVRQPLYSGSIGRWKRYGDSLNDLRKALGSLAR